MRHRLLVLSCAVALAALSFTGVAAAADEEAAQGERAVSERVRRGPRDGGAPGKRRRLAVPEFSPAAAGAIAALVAGGALLVARRRRKAD